MSELSSIEKLDAALEGLSNCAKEAQKVQNMLKSVLDWKGHLAYLVGHRVVTTANVVSLSYNKKENNLQLLDARFELRILGSISELQSLACSILATHPLIPEIKKEN